MTRCCILYNQPREGALPDELDILDQVEHVESHLGNLGIDSYRKGITSNFMQELADLNRQRPDYVFNLTESIGNKGELVYFIPAILNMYSIPYTGNPLEAMFITTSKVLTGSYLDNAGISSPRWFLPSECNRLEADKKYIIKPIWEDGSLGITHDSVFTFYPGYEKNLEGYSDRHWVVQEFIDGREFNISLIKGPQGPEVLPAAEMTFIDFADRPRIVDFKAKWEHDSFEYINTVRRFPGNSLEPELEERLRKSASECWDLFGLKGYARVDMRVDSNNIPYVIEVNANPCISPDGGFVAATQEAGYNFNQIIQRIIDDLNI
jgi:D-alanine-D-alanine ligase